MREEIVQQIESLEEKHAVKVLFACESGSRAWGFASPDSDFDVRFIYVRHRDQYLSIRERRDVIELPVNELLDISGWDIRKTLQLFLRSNATLYEWLQSPIVYKEESDFAVQLRARMSKYFSNRAGCHHYLSMTRNTFDNDLQGEEVRLKRYFYALRPALALRWILERRSVPPMEFQHLRALVTDPGWQDSVDQLLERKAAAPEKAMIAPVGILQTWIANTLAEFKERADALLPTAHEADDLDVLFRKTISA